MSLFGGNQLSTSLTTTTPGFTNPATTLSFGATTNFSFPAATTAASTAPTGFGATTKTTTASVGLGGVDPQASSLPRKLDPSKPEESIIRENLLPNEISSTVESFKQFVRDQRTLSADISRGNIEPVQKVRDEIDSLRGILASMSFDLQKNAVNSSSLKADMKKALMHAEMAQKTHEVPAGLQYENTEPLAYFMELVQFYEKELVKFREKIELTNKHLHSLVQPKRVGEQDLVQGMKQIHETLITLAGRLQNTHHEVQTQKQMYLQLRRVMLDDTTDVFAARPASISNHPVPKNGVGPSPFVPGGFLGSNIFNNTSVQQNKSAQTLPALGTGSFSNSLAPAPNVSFGLNTTDTFNLQRPPVGNKRGKH